MDIQGTGTCNLVSQGNTKTHNFTNKKIKVLHKKLNTGNIILVQILEMFHQFPLFFIYHFIECHSSSPMSWNP